MVDILVRGMSDDVIAVIDTRAAELGLSRSEFVRRLVRQEAQRGAAPVGVADLIRFSGVFADLADSEVMGRAWT